MMREEDSFSYVTRKGIDPKSRNHPGFGYRKRTEPGVIIEKDVAIPMRDGVKLYANIYRPDGNEGAPVIINFAPFGKDRKMDWDHSFPGHGVDLDSISPETPFECFDTVNMARDHGYAVVIIDSRGAWYSEGDPLFFSNRSVKNPEARDCYDIVEWLAAQSWCSGKVCWGGVSYLAMTAWAVSALRPPHLTCIVPWDAASDVYRECDLRGGIPVVPMTHGWMNFTGVSLSEYVDDMEANTLLHPMFDEYWQCRMADWSQITVPCYAVTEWSNDLHLRGTIRAWNHIASKEKFLSILGGKEWSEFYKPENQGRILQFLDYYMKGRGNEVPSWPRVRYAVREGDGRSWYLENADSFPPRGITYKKLYLDVKKTVLTESKPRESLSVSYESLNLDSVLTFDFEFKERTEICGHVSLNLWVKPENTVDGDVFASVEKINAEGNRVPFTYSQIFEDGPVTRGELRISHRELDEEKSTPEQPYHPHQRRLFANEDKPVLINIEIWPTNIVYEKGEKLRIQLGGHHLYDRPEIVMSQHFQPTVSFGNYTVYSGGEHESYFYFPMKQ